MKKNKNIISLIGMILTIFMLSMSATFAADDFSDIRINLVNQDPNPVIAGDIVNVRVGVENWGYGVANDVIIEAISEYPFEVVSKNIEEIGSIQSTDSDSSNMQIVKFKLKVSDDIAAGSYELVLKEYSKNTPNVYSEHSVYIDVKSRESLEIVSIDKSEILPGKIETITFDLKNVGSSILRDVLFSWENAENVILPVGSDNSVYIKSIGVGESIKVSFDILSSASAIADLYNLDLKVAYQDSIAEVNTEYLTKAGIYVGGDTSFDLVFDESSMGSFSFTIANIGANNAESVTVRVPSQTGWNINSGSSDIIGNLNKGDYTTLSFELSKLNIDSINLIIDYTNTLGNRVSVEKQVDVFTQSSVLGEDGETAVKTGSGSSLRGMSSGVSSIVTWSKYAGYAFVALIVLLIGAKLYRKRKK